MISLLSLFAFSAPAAAWNLSLAAPRQAVVVKTSHWNDHQGTLQRHERSSLKDAWRPAGEVVPIVVGRSGMGWGVGLHSGVFPEGPEKREGDGRSPAGIFKLSSAFGYAPAGGEARIKLPYMEAIPTLRCVDDFRSRHYNRIVDTSRTVRDWKSDEAMRRGDNQYRLGIVVDHNTDPAVPGRGSCIFIHIWIDSGTGTAGCTAMAEEIMEELLGWLDPALNPVLIQLPAATYQQLLPVWGLP